MPVRRGATGAGFLGHLAQLPAGEDDLRLFLETVPRPRLARCHEVARIVGPDLAEAEVALLKARTAISSAAERLSGDILSALDRRHGPDRHLEP